MAEKKIYIGSFGPYLFDDTDPIDDGDGEFPGVLQKALTSNKQMNITEAPTEEDQLMRLVDTDARTLAPIPVADINDPSSELGGIGGTAGTLILVYQVMTNEDEATLYKWDAANASGVNVPYVVAGSSGFWIAVAGKYNVHIDAVVKNLFNAQTILSAVIDNTPVALTIEEQRLIGRITGGDITDLTSTEIRTLINVEDGADVTKNVFSTLICYDGDIVIHEGNVVIG